MGFSTTCPQVAALLLLLCCNVNRGAVQRNPCRWCHSVSHVWHGTAYKCGFCPRVPQGLPTNLTWLHLLAYESTSLGSYSFNKYRQLVDLRLSDNVLTDIPAGTLKHLNHLRHLYLSDNRLIEVPNLPKSLRVLHIQGNNITRLPVLHMSHLQDLLVDRNRINKIESRVFKHAPSLSLLSLTDNLLEIADLENVLGLQVLSLERNRMVQFPRLPLGVVVVYLDWNNITILPELILYELEELHLSRNSITHVANTTFLYVPKLRLLDLSHNPLVAAQPALLSLGARVQVDLTPIPEVSPTPCAQSTEDMPTGYMWTVATVSSFAFLSALMTAFVVVLLTKTPCGRRASSKRAADNTCGIPEDNHDNGNSKIVPDSDNSDEEKLVSRRGSQS